MESRSIQPSPAKASLELIENRRPTAGTKQRQAFPCQVQPPCDAVEFEEKLTLKARDEVSAEELESDVHVPGQVKDPNLGGRGGDDGASECQSNLSALAESSELTFGVLSSVGQVFGHGLNHGGELSVFPLSQVSHPNVQRKQ